MTEFADAPPAGVAVAAGSGLHPLHDVPGVPAPDLGERLVGSLGPLTQRDRSGGSTLIASVGSWLEHFHGPVAYVVCGLLVFGEAAVLLGFVIPGETAALIGGVLAVAASRGPRRSCWW